jgi:hypothetical protein
VLSADRFSTVAAVAGYLVVAAPIVVAAIGVSVAALTFVRSQKWQQLRTAAEIVDKVYSDENLRLAVRFLDWHDRDIYLPKGYVQYGNSRGVFAHKVSNMIAAMDTKNRCYDGETRLSDLKEEYRKPEFIIYVEVFDQFFDYLCQVYTFMKAGLIKSENMTVVGYMLRRLDRLGVRKYLELYQFDEVISLMNEFKESNLGWISEGPRDGTDAVCAQENE